MNIVTRPEASVTNEEAAKKAEISAEERARRKAAVDYARGSVRLEGFIVSPFAEDLNRRYIDGEITSAELTALLLAHHKQ
jgi:antitoxin VbhA-like protein